MITAKEAKQGTKFKSTINEESKELILKRIKKAMENGETKTNIKVSDFAYLFQWTTDPIISFLIEYGYKVSYDPEEYSSRIYIDWTDAN